MELGRGNSRAVLAATGKPALKEIVMTKYLRWIRLSLSVAFVGAIVALSGCAAQAPAPTVGVEQKIEKASSRLDHEALASQYERQALADEDAAKRHRRYAEIYRKNTSQRSGVEVHAALAAHCDKLARTYEEAAGENRAMVKLHRELATAAK